MWRRVLALGLGSLLAILLGSSMLFLAGLSRADALGELAGLLGPAHAADEPDTVERRDPCEIEPPPPVQHPFDRSALAVTTAVTAEAEAQELRAELANAASLLRDGDFWGAWGAEEDIDGRRAIFATRFGRSLADTSTGKDLADDAARMLADVERGTLPAGDPAKDSYAALFRVMLLDLAGRTADASAALAVVQVHHFCGNCAAAREDVVRQRRSEAEEREGDWQAALLYLDVARESKFGFPVPPRELLDVRHGLLMLQAGRDWQGVCLLQRVVDLFPDGPGAEVARAALVQVGALRDPDPQRIRRMYVDGREERDALRKLGEAVLSR